MSDDPTEVAIACQGGGSHTAFTAGVLQELLRGWDDGQELVEISGTLCGAVTALTTWYGLVTADAERSIELLDASRDDLSASDLPDQFMNEFVVGLSRLTNAGIPVFKLSPCDVPGAEVGKTAIRETLKRHIDFAEVSVLCRRDVPELVVGTVNVNAGTFETLPNGDVTPEAVLASAAVPTPFNAVEINGHYHWDGLFSQNPPLDDLMTVELSRKRCG
ncbi:patatin-like phospholipase family protein [Haloplanus sp.]|uniref:patatin-like phospholipase family protein n=1 Tax=Haloplanus sp. TaxID=1961696 RepID=UPI002605289D|nr:patatin-like phospholipase family protein [Haloplanus sp.]